MKILSIIVPIYKAEPYVERCLRSLEEQDIPREKYEIICINDGSPDNSLSVLMRLHEEFGNIIIINQENKGVAMARNKGIDLASGEYILMVDADDFIMPDILKKRLDLLIKKDLDIGFAGYTILDEILKEEFSFNPLYNPNNLLTGIDFYNTYLRGKSEIRDSHRSWAIFFKTSFLNSNNLRYLEGVPYLEDGEMMARATCLATRVIFINDPIYMRTTIKGSATQSTLFHSEKARNGFLKSANNLLQFKLDYCRDENQKIFMNQSIVHFTLLYLTSIKGFKYIKLYSHLIMTLKEGPLKRLETEGCSDFYKKMGNYYNSSIQSFYMHWMFFRLRRSLALRVNKLLSK